MVHLQSVGEQRVLRADHVVVGVLRKPRAKAVARLARLAVTDAVRQDDEVARGVEQLPGSEQLAAERAREEAFARPARAVENQHRVAHDARCVASGRADRPVVQVELRQRLAGAEAEIADDEIAFDGCGEIRGLPLCASERPGHEEHETREHHENNTM